MPNNDTLTAAQIPKRVAADSLQPDPAGLEGPDRVHGFEIELRTLPGSGGQRVVQCEAVPDSATDCNDNCVPDECDIADNPANNDNVIYVL